MDDIKEFYELKAAEYSHEWYSNETMLPSIKEYLCLFSKENPRILDLGCGPGHESMRLKNNRARVVGIDYSGESIKIAKSKNTEIQFLEMDYQQISDNLGRFDGVFSCSSMIHLTEIEMRGLLKRIDKVLNTDGLFLIIYRVGEGQLIQNHEINGQKLIRTIERYNRKQIIEIFEKNNYQYQQDGFLDSSLINNWKSLIFKKR
ncbi:MAG: class I SAM-dependent methyltransferase [Spirochaetales bacterium]|nr:class I SAM-dependent methyltransferase [Spirochaetales bacterium]